MNTADLVIIRDTITAAIEAEREACAQVAENFNAAGRPIADRIRMRGVR